jgi:hypothetical protein
MITRDALKRWIIERREQDGDTSRLDLGEGFAIEDTHGVLFLVHADVPTARAVCGFVRGPDWVIYRYWGRELREIFGRLPSHVLINGDRE